MKIHEYQAKELLAAAGANVPKHVVVRTPDGRYAYTFTGEGKPGTGGEFWATHVPGDTCELHYYSSGGGEGFGYVVDKIAHGFPAPARQGQDTLAPEQIDSICGADDSNWAKCYQTSEPQIYEQSRAVARLTIEGTGSCTATTTASGRARRP